MRAGAAFKRLAAVPRTQATQARLLPQAFTPTGQRHITSQAKSKGKAKEQPTISEPEPTLVPSLPRPVGVRDKPVASMQTYVKEIDAAEKDSRNKAERQVL